MKDVYVKDFSNLENMLSRFYVNASVLEGYDVIYAIYEQDEYDGDAFVLLQKRGDGEYYEVNSSHCSCYGLEWDMEHTSEAALKVRYEDGRSWGAFNSSKNALKEHFNW